ncbi:hypothetical protein PAXRUDRAFT_799005 [Paxillus rubicundulus Ve08.2h10]|uniref:Unplaced genomic scaffold scaffold_603, whole genome shotgun sequence n=1 Tax=Paxillus rubicundulus Ve08.2h10 TaxID=930991 RepID=A0A0D0E2N6_9AGAM|nr:hypothetical protein PAXRUDRAFT_799005 [Paxillus rubicundulus Ve08.2h10]
MSPAKKTIDEGDPSFMALPSRLRRRIDSAFDSVASSASSRKRSRLDEVPTAGYSEEPEPGPSHLADYEAGGFIVEDLPSSSRALLSAPSRIHLSEVSRALNLLDLIPDDGIMAVFKNAATGWGAQNSHGEGVSRKDWRAVCTAILEGENRGEVGEENSTGDENVEMGDAYSGSDSDEYRMLDLSSELEEASTDEDEDSESSTAMTAKAKESQKTSSGAPGTKISEQLTARQKAECREDFARFFPDIANVELDHQRIMIKDITHVASLLKEKLKAEEVRGLAIISRFTLVNVVPKILEMLETFSTSPDKSMSLEDFERMMILTKMVN